MSSIDFTAQFLIFKQPSEQRAVSLVVAAVLMFVLMLWGFSQGIFLCVFLLAPILYVSHLWNRRSDPTEVRDLEGTLSVAADVLRVFVKNSYLVKDGSHYVDHCYLCAREGLDHIDLDETGMFTFHAKFIRAFAMEGNQVVEQFENNRHVFTFRAFEPDLSKIETFLAENGFPVTHVTSE